VRPGCQRQVLALEQRLARTSRTVMDRCRGESLATRPLPPQVAPPVNARAALPDVARADAASDDGFSPIVRRRNMRIMP
jgi:hypothetical protein